MKYMTVTDLNNAGATVIVQSKAVNGFLELHIKTFCLTLDFTF